MQLSRRATDASLALRGAIKDLDAQAERYRVISGELDSELVAAMADHIAECLPQLEQRQAAGDGAAIAAIAHGFKGMGGGVGLPELSALGALLEQAAKSAQFERTRELIGALEGWMKSWQAGEA